MAACAVYSIIGRTKPRSGSVLAITNWAIVGGAEMRLVRIEIVGFSAVYA
jgi:hypothetical protein